MRIIEATERGRIAVPISEVMGGSGGIFRFIEETKGKGYFDVDFRGGELVLVAGNFIGQIPITAELAIHVKPKVPISNLARLIGVANQPVRSLEFFRRKYRITADASASITEAIAQSLANSLRDIHTEGVYRQYVPRFAKLSNPRGRPDVGAYLRQSVARGAPMRVPCTFHVLTANTPYNRIVKRAVEVIGETLSISTGKTALIRELEYFHDLLEPVSNQIDSKLLEKVKTDLAHTRLPSLRDYYVQILDISLLILEGHGVELADPSGDRAMHSLIVNLEDAFENYLLQVLCSSAPLAQAGISIQSGNTEGKKSLFSDNERYDAKPDLVIRKDSVNKLIGDAKYKSKTDETDRYQLISHALSYGANMAFFITPCPDGEPGGGTKIGEIGPTPLVLYQYNFNLNAADLVDEESRLCKWIETAIG